MMKGSYISGMSLLLVVLMPLSAMADQVSLANALVIGFDDREKETQVFKDGVFYHLLGDRLNFRAESGGNCTLYIPEQQMQVVEKCSEFGSKMEASVKNLRAEMGMTEEQMAMMQQFAGRGGKPAPFKASGAETIAGLEAVCFSNGSRKVCVSKDIEEKIKAEGIDAREMSRHMAASAKKMGSGNPDNKQLDEIYQRGYPVLDVESAVKPNIPGWDFLDDASKKRILAQMGGAGAGGAGRQLVSVDKKPITLVVPELEEVTIEEMMKRMVPRGM